jgi:hypothetical protein
MAVNAARKTRSDTVRRRRIQQARRRFEATARASGRVARGAPGHVRPLVGAPRRTSRPGARKARRRIFGIAIPDGLSLNPSLLLPALPRRVSWRVASASMCVLLLGLLYYTLTDPSAYVQNVNLGGAALVPGDEIFQSSGIAGKHIAWVDPAEAQRQLERVPGILSAQVSVEWPNRVTIVVTERIPVVTWIENGRTWWVDADGQKFKAREDLPGLLPIYADDLGGKVSDPAAHLVPVAAIHGALQLRELRPNIELLYFHPLHGLSYPDGRGWRGYFGMGTDMPHKLAVYETITQNLTSRGIYPSVISVENPKAPFYRH